MMEIQPCFRPVSCRESSRLIFKIAGAVKTSDIADGSCLPPSPRPDEAEFPLRSAAPRRRSPGFLLSRGPDGDWIPSMQSTQHSI